jgi:N,N'-diacetyllegionaminate synthase
MFLKKNKTLIIAEIGVNHDGSIAKAKKLIRVAKSVGADYAKFQMYIPDEITTKYCKKTRYQIKAVGKISQHKMLSNYYLSFNKIKILEKYCKKNKINFIASVFDEKSLENLSKLKTDFIKLHSSEISNFFLLKALSRLKTPVIFSTGMSNFKEIEYAFKILKKNKKIVVPMYCVSSYPAKVEEVDLKKMLKLKKKYTNIGLSDHTISLETSIITSYLGVNIIERHITLDKKFKGPDHSASLDPNEFKIFVDSIRNVEILNSKNKISNEMKNLKLVRKFLVAKKNIKKGQTFSIENLSSKRTGGGIPANSFFKISGKIAKKNFNKDEIISI